MFRTLVLALLTINILAFQSGLRAQCDMNLHFKTQTDIDSFVAWHPDCQHINGSVTIASIVDGDVTSLAGLSQIQTISGTLTIWAEPGLSSLSGLQNITSVGGLTIRSPTGLHENSGLQNLEGLEGLLTINGALLISRDSSLTSLTGLDNLTYIGNSFKIEHSPALQTLQGVENLTTIEGFGNFELQSLDALSSISALNGLESVNGWFKIINCPNLASLAEFPSLTEIGDDLWISKLDKLEIVDGFNGLTTLNRNFIFNVCKSLRTLGGFTSLVSIGKDVFINTNQSLEELTALDRVQEITGSLTIENNELMEAFPGGNALTQVGQTMKLSFNDVLKDVEGFKNLETVGGDLAISSNFELSSVTGFTSLSTVGAEFRLVFNSLLSDCGAFCDFLSEGNIGSVFISSNGENCRFEETIIASCNPTLKDVTLTDANLRLTNNPPDGNDIVSLMPEELILIDLERAAVAADGVSKLLLKFNFKEAGQFSISWDEGLMETPWGTETYADGASHYGFALYTPPEVFGIEGQGGEQLNGIDMREIQYTVSISVEGEQESFIQTIPLVRPPVILVHGTFSAPDKAWKTPSAGGQALFDILTNEGFKVFAVDYQASNGSGNPSSFESNTLTVWDNEDGIKDALSYYRTTANIAVTQADVIGHSMGGVLPRVYASDYYNPDGYKRADNFMEGDINRFISLAGNHFGSNLGELQVFLADEISPINLGPLDWIAQQAINYISAWMSGTAPSEAVRDQLPAPGTAFYPAGDALSSIGATAIPAHAITLAVPSGGLKDTVHDPHEENYDLYWYLAMLMYYNTDVRDLYLDHKLWLVEQGYKASTTIDGGNPQDLFPGYNDLKFFKTMIEDKIQLGGEILSVMDGDFETPSDIEILKAVFAETEMSNFADPMLDIFVAGEDPIGVAAKFFTPAVMPTPDHLLNTLLTVHEETIEGLRSLIFNNDHNDGVIRVESQRGDLDKSCNDCVTHFDNVLHGFAPRYPEVQQKILSLLNGGMKDFDANGFPAADHAQMLYYPQEALDLYKVPLEGDKAICRSGMVPEHAKAFARVADQENVIIIARPVNPDATALISSGASTKEMNVKPKSSNWGPQKGYLPVNQRYSKLWKIFEGEERSEKIDKYNEKSFENLDEGITTARHLEIQTCEQSYLVYIDRARIQPVNDMSAEDEVVLVPVMNMTKVCQWKSPYDPQIPVMNCEQIGPQHQLQPFEVMATPREVEADGETHRFLTADYDLLMIGFYKGPDDNPYDPPKDLPFKDGIGQMTKEQEGLLDKINDEVNETGYDGGNVSHHGPENQFGLSPYIDYPLAVFTPDDIPNSFLFGGINGRIISIEMGPLGFRDINLKRFVNDMRRRGYDLYDNPDAPGWKWTWKDSVDGFLLEDSKDIPDYVEQLSGFKCENPGEAKTICPDKPEKESPEELDSWLFGRQPPGSQLIRVSPNPVIGSTLGIYLKNEVNAQSDLFILDAIGNRRMTLRYGLVKGAQTFDINISNLESGVYTITGQGFKAVRFVRM